jgi:hypothetical protein
MSTGFLLTIHFVQNGNARFDAAPTAETKQEVMEDTERAEVEERRCRGRKWRGGFANRAEEGLMAR